MEGSSIFDVCEGICFQTMSSIWLYRSGHVANSTRMCSFCSIRLERRLVLARSVLVCHGAFYDFRSEKVGLYTLCRKQRGLYSLCRKQRGLYSLCLQQRGLYQLCRKHGGLYSLCLEQRGLHALCRKQRELNLFR